MDANTGFPPLYTPWINELLAGIVPAESKATCDNCAMCSTSDTTPGMFFDPSVRCCTYEPAIPNYLVGRILEDHDPTLAVGQASVKARIAARSAVTPWGLEQSSRFRLLYDKGRGHFGRVPDLRCPHYVESDAGTCGIWRHRPGVCATWFCKHERGQLGHEFWQRLAHLFREIERGLGIWCVAELGGSSAALIRRWETAVPLEASDLGGAVDETEYAKLWGHWRTQEQSFFLSCAQLVKNLNWTDISSIGGLRLGMLSEIVKESYGKLTSAAIPERLTVGSFEIAGFFDNKFRVRTYSEFDPLLMPATILSLLPYFDGRPTLQALEAIRVERNLTIDPSLVRRMVDFGILVAAG